MMRARLPNLDKSRARVILRPLQNLAEDLQKRDAEDMRAIETSARRAVRSLCGLNLRTQCFDETVPIADWISEDADEQGLLVLAGDSVLVYSASLLIVAASFIHGYCA
jgi:hypothetical protein